MTNLALVKNIMQKSNYGVMSEVFVIEALRYYSEVHKTTKVDWSDNGLISQDLWRAIASEVSDKIMTR